MGCYNSLPSVGLDGSGAKTWFGIEDSPVSLNIKRRKDGKKGMAVEVAGLDKYGLLGVIGRAFISKGFVVSDSEWKVRGALFYGYFVLRDLTAAEMNAPVKEIGEVKKLATEYTPYDQEHSVPRAYSPNVVVASHELVQFKLDMEHDSGKELRLGCLAMVRHLGGHTISGNTRTLSGQLQRDVFVIDFLQRDIQALTTGAFSSPEALHQALLKFRATEAQSLTQGEGEVPAGTKMEPADASKFSSHTSSKAADTLLNALRAQDQRAMQKQMLALPPVLRQSLARTPYRITPTSWGLRLEGFHKYMGSGLVQKDEKSVQQAPVLEFTTFFVSRDSGKERPSATSFLSATAFQERRYGEFVSSIDINTGCFTVQKVFLNNTLPTGKKLGAQCISEQLFAPMWERGAAGLGEILPVNKIKKIKLSDVVNWNTYAVMCVALRERGARSQDFGEHFNDSLKQELRAANLTLDECKTLPLKDILFRACLGKLILTMIEFWHSRTFVLLECSEVSVAFLDDLENIAGDFRNIMDITCHVHVRVATEAPKLDPMQMTSSTEATTEAVGGTDEALSDLLSRDDHLDHGFRLGQEQAPHDSVRSRPVLVAVSRAVHELQRERVWACRLGEDGNDMDHLKIQRKATDAALINALGQTTSTSVQMVSTNLLLLRSSIDNRPETRCLQQTEKYQTLCSAPQAFNTLIGILLEWLILAVTASSDFSSSSSKSLCQLSYLKESLGRERALFLCDGPGLRSTLTTDGERNTALMSSARKLIDELLQRNKDFVAVFRQLDSAQNQFLLQDRFDGSAWFNALSLWLDTCQSMIEKQLSDTAVPVQGNLEV